MSTGDPEGVREALAHYCYVLDAGDADGYAELFTLDGVLHAGPMGGTQQGREAIRKLASRFGEGRARHFTTNERIEVTGDQARAESYLLVVTQRAPGQLGLGLAGRYEDRLVHSDGRWLFAERRVHFDLPGEL